MKPRYALRRRIRGRTGEWYPSGTPLAVRRLPGRKTELRDAKGRVVRVLGPSKFGRYVLVRDP